MRRVRDRRLTGSALHAELVALLAATGPRPSGSPAERALGRAFEARWATFCDDVRTEPFKCHPSAFLACVPVSAACTLASWALLTRWPAAAMAVAAGGAFVLVAELLRYRELLDPLFPAAESVNVIGVVRSDGPVTRRVILSAHQDSAWEFNVWYAFGQAAPVVNLLGLGVVVVPIVAGAAGALGLMGAGGLGAAWWTLAVASPLTAVHLGFHTFRPVPGAMDDLAGLVVITDVGRALAAARPVGLELVLLACGAEECGLRGSKAYAARHAAAHADVPTFVVNVDGVYDEAFLTVITSELTLGVRHDPTLIALAEASARDLGLPMRRASVPIGATDAAAFAQAGLRTVSLLCQDTHRLAPNYHTRRDTPDLVRPMSLGVMRDVVRGLVERL